MKTLMLAAAAATLLTAGCGPKSGNSQTSAGGAQQITGAGSTFVYPVLSAWAADYQKQSGASVNYQSIGSGGGVAQIKAGTVDFGATDQPLDPQELASAGLAQFPVVIGGVVPVVNIAGVQPGTLRLTGSVLADIYAGKIKSWNDPAIARLNGGVSLPAAKITVVHRSDGSGTSFNFTHYLSQVSPAWKSSPGEGKSVAWPTGVGGKGNEGVAGYVKQIPNSIGYVEYAYVLQNQMAYALVRNSAGSFVAPSGESFQAAAASADWKNTKDFFLVITNAPGADAYPITATTFILMHRQAKDKARSAGALRFFRWALENWQPHAQKLDYVPLPADLVQQIEAYIGASIK